MGAFRVGFGVVTAGFPVLDSSRFVLGYNCKKTVLVLHSC